MNLRDIETLVDLVHVARVAEVTIRANGRRVTIRKDPNAAPPKHAPIEVVRAPSSGGAPTPPPPPSIAKHTVTAPMVGVFHAPEPVLKVGATVAPGQVIGVIESMRLMNDVRAETSGIVEAILVEDGMAVEYGQTLLRLDAPTPDELGEDGE
jgi:acetyl-CoA carboxylase biotin carboxyl carrier protein